MLRLLLGLGVAVASPYPGTPRMRRVEQSFSSIPFGTHFPLRQLKLTDPRCQQDGECEYVDANHVVHAADEEGRLAIKAIDVKDVGGAFIGALAIGRSRSQAEVVRKANAFLRGPKLDCSQVRVEHKISCGVMLGEGWVTLFFSRGHELTGLRVDAFQVN